MELVEAKYKNTEIGEIPYDWEVKFLGECTTKVGSGITPKGGEKVYKTNGHPFVRSQNVGWGNLLKNDLAFIDDNTHSKFEATEIKQGDVFLNITGASIGRSAIADKDLVGGNVNQHVCIIRSSQQVILPKFLNFILLSKIGQKQIDSFQAGGNREGLNFGQIRSFVVPLPPTLTEQRAIATALSDVDALITSLDQLIEKKKAIKQGAMQELLTGKTRVAGFGEGVGYKQTEVGVIPEDWEVKLLGFCLDEQPKYGIGAAAVEFNLNLPTYLRITDIDDDGRLVESDLKSVDHIDASNYYLETGDIVLARTGASVGKSYFYYSEDRKLVYAGFLIKVKANPKVLLPSYLNAYLKTSAYWRWVNVMSMRSGQPGINSTEYASLPISLPPTLTEQKAIAQILELVREFNSVFHFNLLKT
ncbi:MAG: hypothetical protein GYB31_11340, partial [Bacteroidetes bacterium]|nr:hypothetical protein [Bacteroidota bacterium]